MADRDGGMTEAEMAAYTAKEARERPARDRLTQEMHEHLDLMERNYTSLTHWRRLVRAMGAIIATFQREEAALPPFEGSSFMRELCAEDPVLWAEVLAASTREA